MKKWKFLLCCKPVIWLTKEFRLQLAIINEGSEMEFPDGIGGYSELATYFGRYLSDCMQS